MTAAVNPSDASPDQALALVNQNRERLMQALEGQFNTVWQALLCLPDGHSHKDAALAAIDQMWATNSALVELMQQQINVAAAIVATAEAVRAQRDQIAGELAEVIDALHNHWSTNNPLVNAVHEQVVEAHNAAFWESLPYDMAAVLGEQWSFMDADLLYSILTADPEEMWEDGSDFGFTPEQLAAFRQNLLVMMRAFVARIGASNGH